MYNLKLNGTVEFVKSSTFEGKTVNKLQFINITDKGVEVKEVKLLENQDITKITKGSNIEMEVKLFTTNDKKEIYVSQVGELKILKETVQSFVSVTDRF